MYDPKSEAQEFIGTDLNEILLKASDFFGVDAAKILVRELAEDEVSGLSGRAIAVARVIQSDRAKKQSLKRPADKDLDQERTSEAASDEPSPAKKEVLEVQSQESTGVQEGVVGELGKFLLGVIERMGLGPFIITETEESQLTVFQIKGEAAAQLASGEGRAADALQLIANQAAHRLEDQPKRVVVDIEGDSREQREDYLARVASTAARRARQSGRAIALEAMNPKDRRGIHEALRDAEDVATMSVGDGRYRQVVVVPKGAPEYEEALKYSS